MKSILVPGDGSFSKDVRDVARSISFELTHELVKEFVEENFSGMISKASGGTKQYPRYKFLNVRLVSASELAKKAELLLFTITWE